MTRGASLLLAGLTAALSLAVAGSAVASPESGGSRQALDQTWYERSFVVAANTRCRLFDDRTASALAVGAAQARGAALRAGLDILQVNATAQRAGRRAAAVSCSDRDLQVVRRRVETAFAGWTRLPRMGFENWQADRVRREGASWSLSQQSVTGRSPVTFGLVHNGGHQQLAAVVSFVGRPRPVSARLVMRDPGKSQRPWLTGQGLAPVALRQSLWASGQRTTAETLLTAGATEGQTWLFPMEAAAQLEALDSREAFAVEFHFRDGTVAIARFKAGDLAAGRAFLNMGML